MSTRQRKLHQYLWYFLLLLLFIVLSVGLFIVIFQEDRFPFLFVVGAFSIAYALHVFSVSGTLCGIYVRECNDNKAQGLDELEYPIVTSAMCALAGGLIILLSGGLLATELPPFLAVWTYAVGPLFLLRRHLPTPRPKAGRRGRTLEPQHRTSAKR